MAYINYVVQFISEILRHTYLSTHRGMLSLIRETPNDTPVSDHPIYIPGVTPDLKRNRNGV